MTQPKLYIITGAMASGKSTVGEAISHRFAKSVHLRGDVFRKMIVNGAAEMGPDLSDEARKQLTLRYTIAIDAAHRYYHAGFTVIYQDIIIADDLEFVANELADLSPQIVVLTPDVNTLAKRDKNRGKTGYSKDFPPNILAEAIMHNTPRIGLWIDSSTMSVNEVVDYILTAQ